MKQNCFRRVQVLGLAVTHRPAAKADRAAACVANRKHDALAEAIVVLAVVLANNQAGREQALDGLGVLPNLSRTLLQPSGA